MASDVPSVLTPAISLTQGSAPTQVLVHKSGNTLPQDGKVSATSSATQPTVGNAQQPSSPVQQPLPAAITKKQQQQDQQRADQSEKADLASQVEVVSKYLNASGRAATFRASSNNKFIEEVNPATGEVVAQYSATVFAALARSVGITGASVVDEHA